MPLLEHNNKHIAKIPNCKMRSSLRGSTSLLSLSKSLSLSQSLLLLLLCGLLGQHAAWADTAIGGGGAGGGGAGAGGAMGTSATALSGGGGAAPSALNANLTDLGSPGVYNSTNGLMLITC